tara:strand:- start:95 stop:355 length:261 start_codon:yes stop_codon:yes gene_type:complete
MITTKTKPMEITATIDGEELIALFNLIGQTPESERVELGLTKEHSLLLSDVWHKLNKSGCGMYWALPTPNGPSHIGDAFTVPLRDS